MQRAEIGSMLTSKKSIFRKTVVPCMFSYQPFLTNWAFDAVRFMIQRQQGKAAEIWLRVGGLYQKGIFPSDKSQSVAFISVTSPSTTIRPYLNVVASFEKCQRDWNLHVLEGTWAPLETFEKSIKNSFQGAFLLLWSNFPMWQQMIFPFTVDWPEFQLHLEKLLKLANLSRKCEDYGDATSAGDWNWIEDVKFLWKELNLMCVWMSVLNNTISKNKF